MAETLVVRSDRLHVALHFSHLGLFLFDVVAERIPLAFALRNPFPQLFYFEEHLCIIFVLAMQLVF